MYSSKDLSIIYDPYFTLLSLTDDTIELKSNNTKHCWLINNYGDFYEVKHKHHETHPYHYQCAYITLEDCFLDISNHDDFQLRGRKPAKYKYSSFFDTILDVYSS